jgi:transposase
VRISTVFNRLLQLQGAYVCAVKFVPKAIVVDVARRGRRHRCPYCSFTTPCRYDTHTSEWRHVALGRWAVFIRAEVARIECPRHGVISEAVPWAVPDSRFTVDFEDLVAWLVREMNKTAVTQLMHIAWATVGRIVERVVARNLNHRRLDDLFVIGLDEVSYRKGHKYLSVVANHETGEPVWIGEGRTRETVGAFFNELGEERTKDVEVVSMDMCGAYMEEVRSRAPQAEIAFDPFHVVKLGSDAVSDVRRSEAREIKGSPEAKVLKGSRWALLKAPEKLKPEEHLKLSQVAQLNASVYRAYLLKEELRTVYQCATVEEAETHLDGWLAWASRSRLAPFVRLGRTVRQHRDGILAAIRLCISNGRLEGLNNKIGVIKHRAYGFHSAAALIAMVFLCCTKMVINLPI